MKKAILLTSITVSILYVSCTQYINPFAVYTPIPVDNVYQLKRDSTSKAEVERLFGKADRTAINERGEVLNYSYFGDSLFIQMNSSGIVSRFNYQPEAFRIEYDNRDITSRNFPARVLRRVVPGRTKLSELTPMFGRPNRGELGTERRRTTFYGRNEDLVVHSTITDDVVIDYELRRK